jgi:prevent-host-death family protein
VSVGRRAISQALRLPVATVFFMTTWVGVNEAVGRLDELVATVEAGGEVILTRDGQPVARLIPVPLTSTRRTPGAWRGRVALGDSFEGFTAEDARDWYGV